MFEADNNNNDHFQNAENMEFEEVKGEPKDKNETSPSVIRFDARFSTLNSEREETKLKFNASEAVPKSQSQFPPVSTQPLDEQMAPEFRPST